MSHTNNNNFKKKFTGFAALASMRFPFNKKANLCNLTGVPREEIDYKNVKLLRKFISPQGRILSSRVNGLCNKHQRSLSVAIKRARFLSILPYC